MYAFFPRTRATAMSVSEFCSKARWKQRNTGGAFEKKLQTSPESNECNLCVRLFVSDLSDKV